MAGLHFSIKENDMKKIILLASALLLSAQAQAAIISGGTIINAVSIQEDSVTNFVQEGFNEVQGFELTRDITVDGGTILKGTRVDSHLIFLNTPAGTAKTVDSQTWTFSGDILGVMSDRAGSLLTGTNDILAAFSTYFSIQGEGTLGPFDALGLEQNNYATGSLDGYLFSGAELKLRMAVTEPGDWIRVVTVSEVPVPAALFLFAPALMGFLGLRRKSKLAA
jgi:hypothetical protein